MAHIYNLYHIKNQQIQKIQEITLIISHHELKIYLLECEKGQEDRFDTTINEPTVISHNL